MNITFGGVIISSEILINRVSTEVNRGRNRGLYAFAFSFSLMVTPVALWLLRYGTGVPFACGGAACFAAVVVMTITLPAVEDAPAEVASAPRLFSRISLSVMTNFIAGFMEGALIALIPLYTLREGCDKAETGMLISAFMLGHGGGTPFIGILADRLGLRRILGLVYGLGIAVFVIILVSIRGDQHHRVINAIFIAQQETSRQMNVLPAGRILHPGCGVPSRNSAN